MRVNRKRKFEIFTSTSLGETYYTATHGCGLRICVLRKKMRQTTALLGVRFGSLYECGSTVDGERREYPSGIAHYLEHLMFSNPDGTDSMETLASLGADANAYTSSNKTVYSFTCTDDPMPALRELLKFVSSPCFTEENVESERPIITQEIKMYLDSPYDLLAQQTLTALYGSCKLSEDILGTCESIARITPELLCACYRDFYRYSSMTLAVCGDVDPDSIYGMVSEVLGDMDTRGETPIPPTIGYPTAVDSPELCTNMPVSSTVFEISIKDPLPPENANERVRRDALMSVVNELIFSRAGELYDGLLEDGLINDSYSYGYSISREAAFNSVSAEGNDPHAVLLRIKQYIAHLRRDGIDPSELTRCKRVMRAELVRDFDSVDDIASAMLNAELDGTGLFEYGDALASITEADVRECLDSSFSDDRFALSIVCCTACKG